MHKKIILCSVLLSVAISIVPGKQKSVTSSRRKIERNAPVRSGAIKKQFYRGRAGKTAGQQIKSMMKNAVASAGSEVLGRVGKRFVRRYPKRFFVCGRFNICSQYERDAFLRKNQGIMAVGGQEPLYQKVFFADPGDGNDGVCSASMKDVLAAVAGSELQKRSSALVKVDQGADGGLSEEEDLEETNADPRFSDSE